MIERISLKGNSVMIVYGNRDEAVEAYKEIIDKADEIKEGAAVCFTTTKSAKA